MTSSSSAEAATGRVIWITGLSGAGKTTLARALAQHLPGAVLLDGDDLRAVLDMSHKAFDRESRLGLAMIYARLCRLLAEQGHVVIIATISLFHEVHEWNRLHLPNYLEVFLDASEAVRRERDPKGLYAASDQGRAGGMAGLDAVVDLPEASHLLLDTGVLSPEDCLKALLDVVNRK